jgi:hypothetical protein
MPAEEFAAANEVTAACTMRGARDSKCHVGFGVHDDHDKDDEDKDNQNEVFFGDLWLSSVETTCRVWSRFKCRCGGILKTNHSRFPKAWMERTMKDWPARGCMQFWKDGRPEKESISLQWDMSVTQGNCLASFVTRMPGRRSAQIFTRLSRKMTAGTRNQDGCQDQM